MNHLAYVAKEYHLSHFITVSFVQTDPLSKRFCLTKKDASDAYSMMAAYAKAVTEKAYGRSNKRTKSPETWLPMVLIPEYRTKTGEPTYMHYHGLIRLPESREVELQNFTVSFWRSLGVRNFNSPIKAEIEPATTIIGSALYSSKNLEDGFTLEKTIVRGPLMGIYS